ncbi:hypothetical protein OAN21_02055 [Alphaproteobacteria bacterium]|nr:hypothetical protein [Alphaproteobacteria bacterium]
MKKRLLPIIAIFSIFLGANVSANQCAKCFISVADRTSLEEGTHLSTYSNCLANRGCDTQQIRDLADCAAAIKDTRSFESYSDQRNPHYSLYQKAATRRYTACNKVTGSYARLDKIFSR